MTDNAGYRPTDDSALRWEDIHCTKCGEPDKKCKCVVRASKDSRTVEFVWLCTSFNCSEIYLYDAGRCAECHHELKKHPAWRRTHAKTGEEQPCVSHLALRECERVLGEIRDHSTDVWAKGLARQCIGPNTQKAEAPLCSVCDHIEALHAIAKVDHPFTPPTGD